MPGQQRIGDTPAFMVAGDQVDRHPGVRHLEQRRHGTLHQLRGHAAAKEQIAAVDHQIDLAPQRRLEGARFFSLRPRVDPPAVGPGAER